MFTWTSPLRDCFNNSCGISLQRKTSEQTVMHLTRRCYLMGRGGEQRGLIHSNQALSYLFQIQWQIFVHLTYVARVNVTFLYKPFFRVKPSPIGVASRLQLKTWVYLQLHLARPCVYFRWLALTLEEIKFTCKSKQVFSPFRHPTQVDANWVHLLHLLIYY